MRSKLRKFTAFTNTLLPHETEYLLSVNRFEDEQKLSILRRVDYNCRHIGQFTPYDTAIDKRKYTNLKNWIEERLKAIDVDERFEWMSYLERQITTDAIIPEEEKRLLKEIRVTTPTAFFFTKFYELVEHYRHFLLIRLRYNDHAMANEYLVRNRETYERSKYINEQIHEATLDIIRQYSGKVAAESIQWDRWLTEVFYDESLDGQNRYFALVRLTFIGLNYRKFDTLLEKFDYIDTLFRQGRYYSKRLLLNYYHNRLLLHAKFKELDQAAYYGYLSIREKNHDYVQYVNNLCAILLRLGKHEEALNLMKEAAGDMKVTKNFHSRISFVSFFAKSLIANGLFLNAENYMDTFLTAYKKEVFQYRWHLFFTTYLESLLFQAKYGKVLRAVRKNNLLEWDKTYQKRPVYLPTIPLYHMIAAYKEGEVEWEQLANSIHNDMDSPQHPDQSHLLQEIVKQIKVFLGEEYYKLGRRLEKLI